MEVTATEELIKSQQSSGEREKKSGKESRLESHTGIRDVRKKTQESEQRKNIVTDGESESEARTA